MGTIEEGTGTTSVFHDQGCNLFLSIDGGGTKTKVTIVGRAGSERYEILGTGRSESSNHTSVGVRSAVQSIGRATIEALGSLPVGEEYEQARGWRYDTTSGKGINRAPFEKVWAGLSGVDGPSDVQLMTIHLNDLFGFPSIDPISPSTRLRVTNDGDLLSAAIHLHYRSNKLSLDKPCKGGIVLIAGTGSIAVAFGPSQTQPQSLPEDDVLLPLGRLGGYGYLLGDEGSAYYVGQQTIKEILKFNDILQPLELSSPSSTTANHLVQLSKMVGKSTLIASVLSHFNIDNIDQLIPTIYSIKVEQERKLKIAELSRLVMKTAYTTPSSSKSTIPNEKTPLEEEDEFSSMILTRSAERLSELVYDLCQLYRLNPSELVLCLGGGMWTYPQFQQLVLTVMLQRWGASWGWIQSVLHPDQIAALSLP